MTYQRYVAIGDSSTEGLDDPHAGGGWRGWADRLAGHVAVGSPDLAYANLAIRGKLVGEVRAEQLEPALALQPDLATVFAGVNDLLRPGYDEEAVFVDLEAMLDALVRSGATTLTITCPDPASVMLVVRPLRGRLAAYNERVRISARRTGALVADVGAAPSAADRRVWSPDRLHANALGHELIAHALADALGLPGHASWAVPLPPPSARSRATALQEEASWWREHFGPWIGRRLRGESMGDGVTAKRPQLEPWGRLDG